MKLRVIITYYSAEETLAEQLDALSGQRWCQPWEVLLVDNRSTDLSLEIAERFRSSAPNLRIVDASARRGKRSRSTVEPNLRRIGDRVRRRLLRAHRKQQPGGGR